MRDELRYTRPGTRNGLGVETAQSFSPDSRVTQSGLYSLVTLEEISGGDTEFVINMLRLFLETMPRNLSVLNDAMEAGDWMGVSKAAHKIKATIDSMAITSLKQVVRIIEGNAKNSLEMNELPAQIKELNAVMVACMAEVRRDHGL